ncbi:MAG: DsbA family oxidoreductase [Acidimicrobiia bacterium]
MRVEIWSDVVCPWCYIGKRRFEQAVERFAGRNDVEIVFRPYLLDPRAAPGVATPVAEVYARKFGGPDRAAQIIDNVTAIAAASGIEFHLDRAVRANTLLAHRLLWFAEQRGVQVELKEQLLQAYFTDGRNVGDPDVLVDAAARVGLDAAEVESFLASDAGRAEVMNDLAVAASNDITAVPTFVFNGTWMVPGAQEIETFERVLERVATLEAREAEAAAAVSDAFAGTCEDVSGAT